MSATACSKEAEEEDSQSFNIPTHSYDLRKRKPAQVKPSSSSVGTPLDRKLPSLATLPQGQGARDHTTRALLLFALFFALRGTLTAVNVSLQRRHLMVWAIFAPKYVFDAVALVVVQVAVVGAHVVAMAGTLSDGTYNQAIDGNKR